MAKTKSEGGRRFFFYITIVIGTILLISLKRIFVPMTMAYILFLILSPGISPLIKLGLNRLSAVCVLFASLSFLTIYPITKATPLVVNEFNSLQYSMPKIENYIRKKYQLIKVEIKEKTGYQIKSGYATEIVSVFRNNVTSFVINIPSKIASVLEWILIVPLIAFFLLKDGFRLRKLVLGITPNSIFEKFYYISHQFNKQLGDYMAAKFIEASIVGFTIGFGLFFLDIKFALILGLLAGITNIIPYIGPIIGALPGILYILAEYGLGAELGAASFLYLIANTVDIMIIFPLLVSRIVNLHPVVVVISVILGSQYLGILGMIISIPVAAAIKLVITQFYKEMYPSN